MRIPLTVMLTCALALPAVAERGVVPRAALDSNKDGQISDAEIAAAASRSFGLMDKNGDGVFSSADLGTSTAQPRTLASFVEDGLKPAAADGRITRPEFDAWWTGVEKSRYAPVGDAALRRPRAGAKHQPTPFAEPEQKAAHDRGELHFSRLDLDHNGELTVDDFQKALKRDSGSSASVPALATILPAWLATAAADGTVTKAEYLHAFAAMVRQQYKS